MKPHIGEWVQYINPAGGGIEAALITAVRTLDRDYSVEREEQKYSVTLYVIPPTGRVFTEMNVMFGEKGLGTWRWINVVDITESGGETKLHYEEIPDGTK